MAGGIPHEAVAASAGVMTYSVFCLTLVTLLVCLLWSYGERWTYVTLIAIFIGLSTIASIVQQCHYAADWVNIKEAQYREAVQSTLDHSLTAGGSAQITDAVLFWIQFYCYNVVSLNILFWTVALFTGSWGLRANWLGDWLVRVGPASKIFAMVFPVFMITVSNVLDLKNYSTLSFVFAMFTMCLSMSVGSILLILTLYKYITTRRLFARQTHRGGWWASGGSKERRARDIGADGSIESGVSSAIDRSLYDRALVTRFTIGFVILAAFEVTVILFARYKNSTNTTLALSGEPDFSIASTLSDILLFMPGVTASLVTFIVFGTSKSWRQYRDLVIGGCGLRRRKLERSQRAAVSGQGGRVGGLEFVRLPSTPNTSPDDGILVRKQFEQSVRIVVNDIGSVDSGMGTTSRDSNKSALQHGHVRMEDAQGRDNQYNIGQARRPRTFVSERMPPREHNFLDDSSE